jgi:NADH-quinone oxidoreductase subunit J
MSLQEATVDFALVASLALLAAASAAAVAARRVMRSILALALVSFAASALLGLFGYAYLAAFYLVVYTGTALALLAFVVLSLGDLSEDKRVPWRPLPLLLSVAAAAVIEAPVLFYALRHPVGSLELYRSGFRLSSVAVFFTRCWLCTILIMVTIAAVLIEAVSVARRPVDEPEPGASGAAGEGGEE